MAQITAGFPCMHKEPGEKRDFLPALIYRLAALGVQPVLETGYGQGMGISEQDYRAAVPNVIFASLEEVFQQDYVLVLRCPDEEMLRWMHPGACLMSMVHYPTRPGRVDYLRTLGLEAISFDSIKDDSGRRLVENLKSVAWNGVEVAFQTLAQVYPPPGLESLDRPPVQVTLLGAGSVGMQVVQAAVNYGDPAFRRRSVSAGLPGVRVNVVDYDLTGHWEVMHPLLEHTDILVDATQRIDPTHPVIPNDWVAALPSHAILLDLSVDPYDCGTEPAFVKGIEGIPQGNLDQYVFFPDDPVYSSLPECIYSRHRRTVVSCYSWPGLHPYECMQVYGRQLQPILRKLFEKGGFQNINSEGSFFERAIARGQLSRWPVVNER